ncbi:hypothetical protein M9H77_18847 [Catharanthus roseus]|uniref:Uncharacterized protein n=1 Tax=Catharanthus roseus TaxID=4058 RepID=A0ACC0B8M5_CATRO|nr:hypothetical protein M9H77_18847 [Catharanthus roseus]
MCFGFSAGIDYEMPELVSNDPVCFPMKKTKNKSKNGENEAIVTKERDLPPTVGQPSAHGRSKGHKNRLCLQDVVGPEDFSNFRTEHYRGWENNFRFREEELGANFGKKNPLNSSSIR